MTLAAKHLDPVLGIDIHIIQPPGPVPPIPIPHPFIGMLIDPADYAPIIGSTVQINNMHRAQAGTAGKAIPPHIPIGGVFVPPPPGNECEMFMGSATVQIDGEAQSYMSLPALSCQSIGMPSIPRLTPKKKTIPKCLMLPTSLVIAIPGGPPVLIGGPPTISLMQMGMKLGMAALGKLGKGLRKMQRGSGKLGKAMRKASAKLRSKVDNVFGNGKVGQSLKKAVCSVTGHPVDIASGKMFTEDFDFELPGPLPLVWERTYYSTSPYKGPLGAGWHHRYDMSLTVQDDVIGVRDSEGRSICFPPIAVGESAFERSERMTLFRDLEGYSVRDENGLQYFFRRVTFDSELQMLGSIENRAGDVIEFDYDKYGRLETIHDSCDRKLSVKTLADGRIKEIRGPHPDGGRKTIRLVAYDYDSSGRMIEVLDALDQPMKFRYRGPLMVQETDRSGLSFYFEYDGSDHDARCTRTWGDESIYNHTLDYDLELKRTVVTNSLGHETIHYWNDSGAVYRAVDPYGKTVETVFNEFGQPVVELDELGQATAYEYDARGNRSAVVSPDGAIVQISYSDLDLPVTAVDPIGNVCSWEYNSRGQITGRTDASGHTARYLYEGKRVSAIIDGERTTEISFDKSGIPDGITAPNGEQRRTRYDALGRPVEVITSAGVQRRTFDLLGRVIKVDEPDGNVRSMAYDAVGNLIYAKDLKHEVRYTYQGMGRLATRREAGQTVTFQYNTEEDLTGIENEYGDVYRFELDANGNVAREFGFDEIRRVYTRDEVGRVTRVERASGLVTSYDYDSVGRVVGVRHSDDTEELYVYRDDGELIEATNSTCTIRFERDEMGRVLKEWQDEFWVASSYDQHGLRTQMSSCFGAVQKIERDVLGAVIGLQYLDSSASAESVEWESRIERDNSGREIERQLPGGIRSRWERDKLGRIVRHRVEGVREIRDKSYHWDVNDQLKQIEDFQSGTVTFQHDPIGNLSGAVYEDGSEELRMPDSIGNLFRTRDRSDRKYGRAGELLESSDDNGTTSFEYDAEGNLKRRTTPDGVWEYSWNATGMLKSVTRPDGEVVAFEYDAIGRRVRKSFQGTTTCWVWDGNKPLHEWREHEESTEVPANAAGIEPIDAPIPSADALLSNPSTGPPVPDVPAPPGLITWLFDPETFAPTAKIVDGKRFSVVTDYLGTPCAMFDDLGQTVWSAEISIYGELREINGDRHECPFRWLGQYEDEETGLYYNRFRYYSPESGRYISQDPLGLVTDAYSYVSKPERISDPFGLTEWVDPKDLNYSQAYVTGETEAYEKAMKDGDWDWDRTSKKGNPVAVLTVTEVDGQLVSFDNRRLLAAQNAGLDRVKVQRVNLDDIKPGTTITWGDSLKKRLNSAPKGMGLPKIQLPANGSATKPKVVCK